MLSGSRTAGATLFLVATIALLGFTLAPMHVPAAPAAPVTTDATETAPVFESRALVSSDTIISVRSERRGAASASAAHNMMVAASIRAEGQDWLGTPYRWGGTTRRGIDCSAFVQQLMSATFDLELPRTTATQVHRGERVKKEDLIPGDLVFFRRRGVRHVGVYLGGGEFIHASSSRGVTVSTMETGYWSRYYWQSRRVIEPFEAVVAEPAPVRNVASKAVAAIDSARSVRN